MACLLLPLGLEIPGKLERKGSTLQRKGSRFVEISHGNAYTNLETRTDLFFQAPSGGRRGVADLDAEGPRRGRHLDRASVGEGPEHVVGQVHGDAEPVVLVAEVVVAMARHTER